MSIVKRLLCCWFGWHRVEDISNYEACNTACCKRCGRLLLLDVDGRWYAMGGGRRRR